MNPLVRAAILVQVTWCRWIPRLVFADVDTDLATVVMDALSARLSSGRREEFGQAETASPLIQIQCVEPVFLGFEDSKQVFPLAIRDAAAFFEPLKLAKDDVLG